MCAKYIFEVYLSPELLAMKRLLLLMLAASCGTVLKAQLLTWTPPFPKENDPAQVLEITVDASKGNAGLLNYTPLTDVYVHIGVITNQSTDSTNWRHVPFTWATTPTAAQAVSLGSNKWKFTISGSLRSYFNIADPAETIQKIAILFRSGNGNTVQRNADGTDMYVPVYGNALAVRIDAPPSQPKYTRVAEPQIYNIGSTVTITSNASGPAQITHTVGSQVSASAAGVTSYTSSFTVPAYGLFQIVSKADNGTAVAYDTLTIFAGPTTSPQAALPAGLRDGINYEPGDTSATLVLRAPGKSVAYVLGEFNNWQPSSASLMNRTPDGKFFWLRLHPLTPATEYAYQYWVDNSIRIADPYTEKVLDKANDPFIPATVYPNPKPYPAGQSGILSVLQTAQPSYTWSTTAFQRPDKRGLMVYELLLRDFVANHDWKTLSDTLNYIKNLGINTIEVMPFNEFEGNLSWGYNTSFYFAPDKYYGTKNALKAFVDSCHKKGIAVVMDIVLNHSFGQSPMVQLYWDAANNRPAADNPWFNPVAKHPFNVGYDMNHMSPDTRYFVSRVVEHWLQEYRLDGFRFDLSKGFTQNNYCTTQACNSNAEVSSWSGYDAQRVAIWKQYYDTLQLKSPGSYTILEHLGDVVEERELADYGMLLWGNLNFNYTNAAIASGDWDFSWGIASVRNFPKNHLVTYMESHDEERIVRQALVSGASVPGGYNIRDTATALKRMELDAAFFFTIPGPKMVWQFGELGYDYSINYCSNGTINNACRTDAKPIRWDYFNDPRRRSVYNEYSRLMALRALPQYREAFLSGTVDRSLGGAFKWLKLSSGDSSHLMVVGNFGTTPVTGSVTFPVVGTWFNYLTNATLSATGSAQNISLEPGEYRVYVNRNVNNVPVTPVANVPGGSSRLEARVYPNPAGGRFTVELNLPQSGPVRIDLYNALGQYAGTLYSGFLPRGLHQVPLKSGQASGGNYYLKLSSRSTETTLQVTLQ